MNGALPRSPRTSTRGRPRKGEAELRKAHVIVVASALFQTRGYQQISLSLISREARVAVRTIYSDFGSKTGLLDAVLHSRWTHFMDTGQALDPDRPLAATLADFARRFLSFLADQGVKRLLRLASSEAEALAAGGNAWRDAGIARVRDMLVDYFNDARIRRQLRADVALELLGTHFMACLAGEWLWPGAETGAALDGPALQSHVQSRLALFLRAVLHPGG